MIEKYFIDVSKFSLLSPKEEIDLAEKIKTGDTASRDLFINSNLRLVIKIARVYSNGYDLPDLIEEGNIAMIKSADRYNPNEGTKFSTYAFKGIERRIWRYLNKQYIINLSHEKAFLLRKVNKIKAKYAILNNKEPSLEYITIELNKEQDKKKYTKDDVKDIINIYQKTLGKQLYYNINGETKLIDVITGTDGRNMTENLIKDDIIEKVREHIATLPYDCKTTIEKILQYGDNRKKIANKVGMTPEQVSVNYDKSMRILRKRSELKRLANDLAEIEFY